MTNTLPTNSEVIEVLEDLIARFSNARESAGVIGNKLSNVANAEDAQSDADTLSTDQYDEEALEKARELLSELKEVEDPETISQNFADDMAEQFNETETDGE